jgi:hypothetical protein
LFTFGLRTAAHRRGDLGLVDWDDHREHTDRDTGDESTNNEHSNVYSSCLDGAT